MEKASETSPSPVLPKTAFASERSSRKLKNASGSSKEETAAEKFPGKIPKTRPNTRSTNKFSPLAEEDEDEENNSNVGPHLADTTNKNSEQDEFFGANWVDGSSSSRGRNALGSPPTKNFVLDTGRQDCQGHVGNRHMVQGVNVIGASKLNGKKKIVKSSSSKSKSTNRAHSNKNDDNDNRSDDSEQAWTTVTPKSKAAAAKKKQIISKEQQKKKKKGASDSPGRDSNHVYTPAAPSRSALKGQQKSSCGNGPQTSPVCDASIREENETELPSSDSQHASEYSSPDSNSSSSDSFISDDSFVGRNESSSSTGYTCVVCVTDHNCQLIPGRNCFDKVAQLVMHLREKHAGPEFAARIKQAYSRLGVVQCSGCGEFFTRIQACANHQKVCGSNKKPRKSGSQNLNSSSKVNRAVGSDAKARTQRDTTLGNNNNSVPRHRGSGATTTSSSNPALRAGAQEENHSLASTQLEEEVEEDDDFEDSGEYQVPTQRATPRNNASRTEPIAEGNVAPMTKPMFGVRQKVMSVLRPLVVPLLETIANAAEATSEEMNLDQQRVLMGDALATLMLVPRGLQGATSDSGTRMMMADLKKLTGLPIREIGDRLLQFKQPPLYSNRDAAPSNSQPQPDPNSNSAPIIRLPERRLQRLVKKGEYSKAARLLESSTKSSGVAPSNAQTAAKIANYFPAADLQKDLLPANISVAVPPLVLNGGELLAGIENLPAESAAGMSGWTYELVQQLALGEDGNNFRLQLLRVFNLILQGRAGLVTQWTHDRIVPLQKPDGGLRPIVISDIWLRILSRIVAKKFAAQAADILAPLQFGVGIPGGCEVITHGLHLLEESERDNNHGAETGNHPRLRFHTIDFANAFNSVHRRYIHEALAMHFPQLLPFFRMCYMGPTPVYFREGRRAGMVARGVRQGDPLGPLYFALALKPILSQILEVSSTETLLQPLQQPLHLLAYLDDITVVGTQEQVELCVKETQRRAVVIGLQMNVRKSLQWGPPHSQPAALDTTCVEDGVHTLGNWFGTLEYQETRATEYLESFRLLFEALRRLDPRLALPLLRATISTSPMYVARTMPPSIIHDALISFDEEVDRTLALMCGSNNTLSGPSRGVRTLRAEDGGIGMARFSAIHKAAFASSLLASSNQIRRRSPLLRKDLLRRAASLQPFTQIAKRYSPNCVAGGSSHGSNVNDVVETPPEGPSVLKAWLDPVDGEEEIELPVPRQRELTAPQYLEQKEAVITGLQSDRHALAWHLSCKFKGSMSIFTDSSTSATLTADSYRVALSLRLLLKPQTPGAFQCRRCNEVQVDVRYHGLNCERLTSVRTSRHNYVRDNLARLLSSLFGPEAISIEQTYAVMIDGVERTLRPDIRLQHGGGFTLIDVSIANPASKRSLERGHSDTVPSGAAVHRELEKRVHYEPLMEQLQLAPTGLVVFVVEASGRLGGEAAKFLADLPTLPGILAQSSPTKKIEFSTRRMRQLIMIGNACCIEAAGKNGALQPAEQAPAEQA